MKVRSPLADMDVRIGSIRRRGNELILGSDAGSSIDATIAVSAREVVSVLWRVLTSGGGLVFVLGLPFFYLRQSLAGDSKALGAHERSSENINKPW